MGGEGGYVKTKQSIEMKHVPGTGLQFLQKAHTTGVRFVFLARDGV